MAKISLKFVNSFYSRGKLRHQFRRTGHPKKLQPGLPGSADFMDVYQALIDRTGGAPTIEIGASRSKAGTIDAAIAAYLKDDVFTKGLAEATQGMRRAILDRFRDKQGPSGQRYGEKGIATLQHRHVVAILDGMTRDAKKNWIKTLRRLMASTIAKNMRADDS